MQKLFVNMGKPCPVQFNVAVPDELGNYNICSRIVYVRPEYQRSTFCPFHQDQTEDEPINDGGGPSDSSRAVDWFFVSLRRSASIRH